MNYIIIGAGVTGLSFANFIDDKNFYILEKENEIGGYCKTVKQDGFTWDYSGHFFHFQNPSIKDYVTSRMPNDELIEVIKVAKIFYKGSYIDFPFQKNIHQLDKNEFIECLYDLYFRNGNPNYTNFEEMVYSKFGKSISDKFLIPYNEKLYACPLNELDCEAMGRFFPHADIADIIENVKFENNRSYNNTFIYPKNGAMEFIHALAKDIDKNKILKSEKLIKVDAINKIIQTSKRNLSYSYLISTIPLPQLLDLLDYPYDSDVFNYNKVLVFNLGFDKKGPEQLHWVYFPEKKYRFYRVGFYDNILKSNRMSLYVEIGQKSDEVFDIISELDIVLRNLEDIGIIEGHQLLSYIPLVLNPAYVHITKESNRSFHEISSAINKRSIYTLGRYGGWKYCSIEDNIIEAKELAKSFNTFPGRKP